MMEAKLRQMESTNPKPPSSTESAPATPGLHPSLPAKPPPPLPSNIAAGLPQSRPTPKTKTPLPSLPILPASLPLSASQSSIKPAAASRHPKASKLAGVKIGKGKEKQVPPEVA
jgi:hypothetical protein